MLNAISSCNGMVLDVLVVIMSCASNRTTTNRRGDCFKKCSGFDLSPHFVFVCILVGRSSFEMEFVEPSLSVIIRVTLIMKSWRSGKRIMIIEWDMIIVEMSILDGIVSHFYSLSLKDSILVFNIDTNNQLWA